MASKTYRLRVAESAGHEKIVAGTVKELTLYFQDMLTQGNRKNRKVQLKPRGIHGLVQNLYRASFTLDMPNMNYWIVAGA